MMRRLLERVCVTETIGQEECPLMERWEFLRIAWPGRAPLVKFMIHHFPPHVTDRDPHDHPRSFVTLVLKGGYLNYDYSRSEDGHREWLGRGAFRFRRADHMHITETLHQGAWTFVIMGPEKRAWGFLRDGRWMPWKPYVDRYGGVVRCESGEIDTSQKGEYAPYRDYKGTPPPA